MPWVQLLESTRWKERIDSFKLSSDFHTGTAIRMNTLPFLSVFPLLSLQYTRMYMCVHTHTQKKMTKNPPANGDKSVFKILNLAKKNIFLVNIGINNLWFWNEEPVSVVSGNTNILSKDNGHKCTLCIMRLLLPKYFPINHRIWIIMNKINPTMIRYSGIHI